MSTTSSEPKMPPLNHSNSTTDGNNTTINNHSDNTKPPSKLKPPVPLKRKNKEKTKDDIVLPGNNNANSSNKSRGNGSCSSNNSNNNNNNKSDISSNISPNGVKRQKIDHHTNSNENLATTPIKIITSKPPLPPPKPSAENKIHHKSIVDGPAGNSNLTKLVKPVKMKKKLEDSSNSALVQKLSLLADKLRLENGELLKALASEKSAVRTLRAQTEAESRRARLESKKLHDTITAQNKLSIKKDNHHGTESPEYGKLNQEFLSLKESCKSLEEKLQISSEVERKLSTDILEMKDMYELRLTQANNTASMELQKLLEEIKTKDRCIEQLKQEIISLNTGQRETVKSSVHEMRKIKDDTEETNLHLNTNSSSNTNSCSHKTNKIEIATTCGRNEFVKMPHETSERILEAHNELNIYSSNKNHNIDENDHNVTSTTDTDSALSSAPSSLSPQPISCPNSPDIWKTFTKDNRINGNKYDHMQKELDAVREENEYLKMELVSAQDQIRDLEKSLFELKENYSENVENELSKNVDKIKDLEEKEETLLKETHELREQNELLEFRIIELEESHDKWSLRSNTTPDTRDVWTDTEKENDELTTDRTDSGITSPSSNNLIEDHTCTATTPLDLSIDHIHQDDVRKRLALMLKRTFYEDDDKLCLMQVLSLLNNLEALSQDQEINGNDLSLDLINSTPKPKSSSLDYPSPNHQSTDNSVKSLPPNSSRNQRIVATVLPYSSSDTNQSPTRTRSLSSSSLYQDSSPKKARFCSSTSLQESGVFEGDLYDIITVGTQTEPEDFPVVEKPNGDLCAEIQKLNKFRERIEECVTKAPIAKSPVANILTETPEQRRLQYYRDRLEHLENKILVYESSGDLQVRRLTDRLQREIQLDSLVKQLSEKLEKLISENRRLEEEKCEFEEAENDTRLRLQRLEFDLEILSQRNIELEMSRNSLKTKSNDYQQHCHSLEEAIQKYQDKIFCLEEHENDMRHQMDLLGKMIPMLVAFHTWRSTQNFKMPTPSQTPSCSCLIQSSGTSSSLSGGYKNPLEDRLSELMQREKELTRNINELNKAYNETLENADNLWAQMERDYKEKIQRADETENALKCKLFQLEERLQNDTQFAQERLSQLEENENNFKQRLARLHKENKDLTTQLVQTQEELYQLKEENGEMKEYLESTKNGQLEKEKRKSQKLEEDLEIFKNMLQDSDTQHKNEVNSMKAQLNKTHKELIHIEVTNGELKEEIFTLEQQIRDLKRQHYEDEEKIKLLTIEMTDTNRIHQNGFQYMKSLAQEMAPISPVKRHDNNNNAAAGLNMAAKKLGDALENIELQSCENCSTTTLTLKNLAKDVKILAETVIEKQNSTSRQRVGRRSTTNLEEPPDRYALCNCSNCGVPHYKIKRTCHKQQCTCTPVAWNCGNCWIDQECIPKRKDINAAKGYKKGGAAKVVASQGGALISSRPSTGNGKEKRPKSGDKNRGTKETKDDANNGEAKVGGANDDGAKDGGAKDVSKKGDNVESISSTKHATVQIIEPQNAKSIKIEKVSTTDQLSAVQSCLQSCQEPCPDPCPKKPTLLKVVCKATVKKPPEFTAQFCCFLKKVKSTEIFIRNLFNEKSKCNKSCSSPDNRAASGVCVDNNKKDDCGLVGACCICNAAQNSTNPCEGKQNLDEIKNTIDGLKQLLCRYHDNGKCRDEISQKILDELKKHVGQEEIDKLLKGETATSDSTGKLPAVKDNLICPLTCATCRPVCDTHGIVIVEWKVKSFIGIGGYEIHVDGILKQKVCSAIRNSVIIQCVDTNCEHDVTITALPLSDCKINSNEKWAPARCQFKPCRKLC